jgi:hypothetical protein
MNGASHIAILPDGKSRQMWVNPTAEKDFRCKVFLQNFGRYAPRDRETVSETVSAVIASEAKQSIGRQNSMDCFVACSSQ